MAITRKDFFRKACLTGACFCGLDSNDARGSNLTGTSENSDPDNKKLKFMQDWISNLLQSIDGNANRKKAERS
jgi:hypothetical protein